MNPLGVHIPEQEYHRLARRDFATIWVVAIKIGTGSEKSRIFQIYQPTYIIRSV